MPHRDLRFSHDYVEDAPPVVPIQGATSGKSGGPVTDHSHTASGDGGTFDAANLRSDEDAEDGAVLSSDGEEGAEWRLLTLGSLSDVNAPDPDDGDVPTWDDSAGEWVASPPAGGAMALDDLTDVDAAAPDDEDVLTWDDVAGKWVAAAPVGGAVDATDVTYTPTTAADWDSSSDPGNADDAFDQLAERVKALEAAGLIGSGVAVQKGSSAALSSNNGNGTVLFATEFDSTPTVAISPRQNDTDPDYTPWVKLTQVATTGFSYAYAFGASGYGGTAMYIDYIAIGPSSGGTVDAADVTYTPTTAADWDSDTDPGDLDDALDQLAERVDDLEAGGGGGGDSTYTAAYASRPAASNDGDLFLPNDGFVVERDTGAAWSAWGPIYPIVPPDITDFAWINQDVATAAQVGSAIVIQTPAASGDKLRILKKAAPATPFTMTALVRSHAATANYPRAGILFRESATGKCTGIALRFTSVQYIKWNSPTSYAGETTDVTYYSNGQPVWLRISDDGTDTVFQWSYDSYYWRTIKTEARGTFFTTGPDEIGFYCDANNGTYANAITLYSWQET